METSGWADLFRRTVAVHGGDFVMSGSRPSIAMEQDPRFSVAHRLQPSLQMLPRSTMIATQDDYRFEFAWIDRDKLLLDAWRGRPLLVVNTAVGSSAALRSVLTTSIPRLPRISISRRGNAERSSPARDAVSSNTTSSQAKFLVRLSSRLAV
jgi:hypothetical protein